MLLTATGFGQKRFASLVKEYFRVNPLEGSFSAFTKAFAEDPDLLNKQIKLQTYTSLFLAKGIYKVFNPFIFKAKRMEVILSENEQVIEDTDSTYALPFMGYQIIAYTDDNPEYRRLIISEFKKLDKKLRKDLKRANSTTLKGVQNIEDGVVNNYTGFSLSPIPIATLGWQTLSQSKQLLLTLLIRMNIEKNKAIPFGYYKEEKIRSDEISFDDF
ncbi:MAG: hypothetical protein IPH58_02390 [Sphingobacteriales bacterium]|nr:hypothetical protein [Sphingobacteriales bacterium]